MSSSCQWSCICHVPSMHRGVYIVCLVVVSKGIFVVCLVVVSMPSCCFYIGVYSYCAQQLLVQGCILSIPNSSQHRGVFVVCLVVVNIGVQQYVQQLLKQGCIRSMYFQQLSVQGCIRRIHSCCQKGCIRSMPSSCQFRGVFVVCLQQISVQVCIRSMPIVDVSIGVYSQYAQQLSVQGCNTITSCFCRLANTKTGHLFVKQFGMQNNTGSIILHTALFRKVYRKRAKQLLSAHFSWSRF